MALIVLLIGFGALSVAGLVGVELPEAAQGDKPAAGRALADSVVQASQRRAPASPAEAAAIAEGDALFKNNCAQCHAVHDKVVGPVLAGIAKRRPITWIVAWVHNPQKVINSGDEYAVKLYNDYGKQQMPAFPQLSDQQIKNIVAWVTAEENSSPATSAPVAYNATAPE